MAKERMTEMDAMAVIITTITNNLECDLEKMEGFRASFLEQMDRCTPWTEQFIEWQTEDMIKCEWRIKEYRFMCRVFSICVEEGDMAFIEFSNRMNDLKRQRVDHLIEFPYRHSSTSLMDNAIKEWKHHEGCDFYGRDMGFMQNLLWRIDKLGDETDWQRDEREAEEAK